MRILILIMLCNLCNSIYASQGDTILTLYRMKIVNPKVKKEIKKCIPDLMKLYDNCAPNDTFFVSFRNINMVSNFVLIEKNGQRISKYEISEKDILGYCIIKKNIFIVCGDDCNQVKRIKKGKLNLTIYDIPPIFDGYPPLFVFRIDKDRVQLIERFIPKGNSYHIKFP